MRPEEGRRKQQHSTPNREHAQRKHYWRHDRRRDGHRTDTAIYGRDSRRREAQPEKNQESEN